MVEIGQFRLGKKKRTAPVTYVSEKISAINPKEGRSWWRLTLSSGALPRPPEGRTFGNLARDEECALFPQHVLDRISTDWEFAWDLRG